MIIKTNLDEIQTYLCDAANLHGNCDAVYFPENEDEIIKILKGANENKTNVTVAGNGTGLTGGRVPEGGLLIATDKLNKVKEINVRKKYAVVEPGVLLKDFQELVEANNLLYPPDPTERNCFIGATVATNASGASTFKYGPTRDFVIGLRVILPTGERLSIERNQLFSKGYDLEVSTSSGRLINAIIPDYQMPKTKNSAGYFCKRDMDLIDIFIGSEGTLGLLSEIKLKLIDLPEKIISSVVFFNSEEDALDFSKEVIDRSYRSRKNNESTGINARGLEYFDKNTLQFIIADYSNIPENSNAAIWFEQEINKANEKTILDMWVDLIREYNGDDKNAWFALNKNEREKFKDFRHAISWKVSDFIAKKDIIKVGTDTAVPHNNFRRFYSYSKSAVEMSGIHFIIYGHIGNSHLHLNMLPANENEFSRAKKVYSDICQKAIDLGGTISAEHGVGKLKRDYLIKMYGEENIKKMAALKKAFDPKKILCIGNIFEEKYI